MDEATWQAKIIGMQWIYNNCELRPLFDVRANMFSAAFSEIVKSFPDKCNLEKQGNIQ